LIPFHAAAALVLAMVVSIAGCGRDADDPRVVLYVSADDVIARAVVAEFGKQTGIRVDMVTDGEAKKTTGLVERLIAERDKPQADVFWSSEIFMTIDLADRGVLDEHVSDATVEWPEHLRDGQRRWHAFAGRARAIAYRPDRVAPSDVPRNWTDLADPKWRGRIAMADPRFGTTGGHLGALDAYWSSSASDSKNPSSEFQRFIDGLASNQVRVLPSGNSGVVRAVVSGEVDLGLTDTDDVWAAQRQQHEIDLVYPRHNDDASAKGGGTLVIPNTVARIKGGSNPQAAAKLIDFLLSEQVERMLAESPSRNIPLRPGLAAEYPSLSVPDPLEVSWERAAAKRHEAVELAVQMLMRQGEGHAR
jgi:iron(III) transport system substrate-binding protein